MPDRQDAALMLQLAHWGAFMNLEEGLMAVMADDFDPDTASAEDPKVNRVLTWGETIGTLTKNQLIDVDLVLDWLWVAGIWSRVAPAAMKLREKHAEPQIYANFEALAAKQS